MKESDIPAVKVIRKVGHRLFVLKPAGKGTVPYAGWVRLNVKGNESLNDKLFMVHHCRDLADDVYYVWPPRVYAYPEMPLACPRCRYRLDSPARVRRL